jgi:hypothetical protein
MTECNKRVNLVKKSSSKLIKIISLTNLRTENIRILDKVIRILLL